MNMAIQPDLTIITSVYNALECTNQYILKLPPSLPPSLRVEKIIINDGSDRETTDFINRLDDTWIKRDNHENRGFAWRNNEGAKAARGKWLLFLNNDIVPQANWLEPMLDVAMRGSRREKVGVVGNLQVYAGTDILNHGGVYFHPGDFTMRHAFDGLPQSELRGLPDSYQWHAVTGACMLIEKELFLSAGSFDERFVNGYEDADLCLRLLKEGYVSRVANRSCIDHHVGSSLGRFAREDENRKLFELKWGSWRHLLARTDYGRIFTRLLSVSEKIKRPREWLLARACLLQGSVDFNREPTMAWQALAHGGHTVDSLSRRIKEES